MSKEELVHLDGEVILIAKGGNFRVKLDNGHEVLAKLAGKVRRHRIRVVLGDRVTVAPCALRTTDTRSPSNTAAALFVVPRSMPT